MINTSSFRPFALPRGAASLLAGLLLGLASMPVLALPAPSPSGISMELSGQARLDGTVTVRFLDGVTPVGSFFDIWVCGSNAFTADRRPDDGVGDDANADCIDLTFWGRPDEARTLQWVLSLDDSSAINPDTGQPYPDASPVSGADYCGFEEALTDREGTVMQAPYYLIVHDFSGGEHSNWLGPIVCRDVPDALPVPVDSLWAQILLTIGLLLMGLLVLTGHRFERF